MFNLANWIEQNLISGVANGVFARERVAIMALDYMLKGILSNEAVERIALATVYIPEPDPVDLPEETDPEEIPEEVEPEEEV